MKEESIGPPKIYLGGHIRKVRIVNRVEAWAFSSLQYVQPMVKNVEAYITSQERWKMHGKAKTPLRTKYRPELDISPKLDPVDASYYMSLVGILQWIVELVRVDICLEVSNMSSHTTLPREVQLEQLLNIFIYLKKHHNAYMVLDPGNPVVEESRFEQ